MKWPTWFPYPSSWLNALLLGFLTVGVGYVVRTIGVIGFEATRSSQRVEPFIFFCAVALLSPVPVIAWVHHVIHLMIGRIAPKIQAPEIGTVKGAFPSLISWWEGLQSWMIMGVSLLIMCAVAALTYNSSGTNSYEYSYRNVDDSFGLILAGTWLVSAAYLYQVSLLVERRLMKVAAEPQKTKQPSSR